ncbi:MAG: chorismate mutase [Bauldia sp.]
MSDTGEGDARRLSELREKIDAIDAEMHRLLIERGSVIDSLIKTKATDRPGAAFRPGREAAMMRRLVRRHGGRLPLATVEHIWREIITTFTRMQAPFDVAIDGAADPARMRDLARFYFGFSVELVPCDGPAAVIARVGSGNDLGLIASDQPARSAAWWRALTGASAPRIMALLPFIRAEKRPADLPAFVISPNLADPTPPDFRVFAAIASGDPSRIGGVTILASADAGGATDMLLAIPAERDPAALATAAASLGIALDDIVEVGGIARGIAVDSTSSALFEATGAGT